MDHITFTKEKIATIWIKKIWLNLTVNSSFFYLWILCIITQQSLYTRQRKEIHQIKIWKLKCINNPTLKKEKKKYKNKMKNAHYSNKTNIIIYT